MSHTRVKTKYNVSGDYGSSIEKTLYCDHNHSCDTTSFYDEDRELQVMFFEEWDSGKDLWDAMNRLWFPFKDKWHGDLKEGVEYYFPKEINK